MSLLKSRGSVAATDFNSDFHNLLKRTQVGQSAPVKEKTLFSVQPLPPDPLPHLPKKSLFGPTSLRFAC